MSRPYNFIDKDPIIDVMRTAIQDQGLSLDEVAELAEMSVATLWSWFHGKTKKPQYASIYNVCLALGGKVDFTFPKAVHHSKRTKI